MGVTLSLQNLLYERFEGCLKLRKRGSSSLKSLAFDQLNHFEIPGDFPIDIHHLPTLYTLDSDKDGLISFEDIMSFSNLVGALQSSFPKTEDLRVRLKSATTTFMTTQILNPNCGGIEGWSKWITDAVCKDHRIRVHTNSSGEPTMYVSDAVVENLWKLLTPPFERELKPFTNFIKLIERKSIFDGNPVYKTNNVKTGDWFPLEVLQSAAAVFAVGYVRHLGRSLGLTISGPLPPSSFDSPPVSQRMSSPMRIQFSSSATKNSLNKMQEADAIDPGTTSNDDKKNIKLSVNEDANFTTARQVIPAPLDQNKISPVLSKTSSASNVPTPNVVSRTHSPRKYQHRKEKNNKVITDDNDWWPSSSSSSSDGRMHSGNNSKNIITYDSSEWKSHTDFSPSSTGLKATLSPVKSRQLDKAKDTNLPFRRVSNTHLGEKVSTDEMTSSFNVLFYNSSVNSSPTSYKQTIDVVDGNNTGQLRQTKYMDYDEFADAFSAPSSSRTSEPDKTISRPVSPISFLANSPTVANSFIDHAVVVPPRDNKQKINLITKARPSTSATLSALRNPLIDDRSPPAMPMSRRPPPDKFEGDLTPVSLPPSRQDLSHPPQKQSQQVTSLSSVRTSRHLHSGGSSSPSLPVVVKLSSASGLSTNSAQPAASTLSYQQHNPHLYANSYQSTNALDNNTFNITKRDGSVQPRIPQLRNFNINLNSVSNKNLVNDVEHRFVGGHVSNQQQNNAPRGLQLSARERK